MSYIRRLITDRFKNALFKGKALIIYGPRQSGKTTFVNKLKEKFSQFNYINCDIPENAAQLTPRTPERLKEFIGTTNLVVLDEAQKITDIGTTLKILIDRYPDLQVVATGSSSFDLANRVVEPLTGRHFDFLLFPFLFEEFRQYYKERSNLIAMLPDRMLFGSYPEVIFPPEGQERSAVIRRIAQDYTMKDILSFDRIRKSDKIILLLKALAYQVGHEVSYNEISGTLGISRQTIEQYISILEQAFIIFRLEPYVRNKRMGLRRTRKIYFWDTGIRNALINNFEPLDVRPDKGALFENYVVSELKKKSLTNESFENFYFWRAYDGEEIDLLVEKDGVLRGYECKWKYPNAIIKKSKDAPLGDCSVITSDNYFSYL